MNIIKEYKSDKQGFLLFWIPIIIYVLFLIHDEIFVDHSGHDHEIVYSETCYGDGPCIDTSHRVCLID